MSASTQVHRGKNHNCPNLSAHTLILPIITSGISRARAHCLQFLLSLSQIKNARKARCAENSSSVNVLRYTCACPQSDKH